MEADEFGPLTSADQTMDQPGNTTTESDGAGGTTWQQEKQQLLHEFGLKRAKFKELYLQKEEENKELKGQLEKLQVEMTDMKAAAALSEYSRQDEAELMQRKYTEELSSLQHVMRASIDEVSKSAAERYEDDRQQLVQANRALEDEVHELKQKLSKEREGFMATVAKSIRRVGTTAAGTFGAENLEDSMRKAQEDVEILRSVVEPLEEEIKCLKDKYRASVAKIDLLEAERQKFSGNPMNIPISEGADSVDSKVKELSENLRVEKSSRSDLELYVAVLNTQKTAAQEEMENLKKKLSEVVGYLELERKQHRDLKTTWQMANDQFLEAQRLLMKDMRRMESLLSQEQQRQLAELQKKDQAEQKPIRAAGQVAELGSLSLMDGSGSPKLKRSISSPRASPHRELLKPSNELCSNLQKADSKTSLNSIKSDDFLGLNDSSDTRQNDNEQDTSTSPQASPDRIINVPSLTAAQQQALRDPGDENEDTDSLLAVARSGSSENDVSLAGKRLVSEREWQMLQEEMQNAREKLGRPCTMCANYEDQLQKMQNESNRKQEQTSNLERALTSTKKSLEKELKYRQELEDSLKNASEDAQKQISNLANKVYESEKFLVEVSQQYQSSYRDMQDNVKKLTHDREKVNREINKLQEENDQLIGRHSKHAQVLQEETINLPDNMEDMQLVLLRYREDVITAKVAKEQIEDSLKSEIMFVKDQLLCEQEEKRRVEETLSADVANLQEQLAILQSVKSELDRESKVRREMEVRFRESEGNLKSSQAKSRQLITALQRQLEEHFDARTSLENEVGELKAKIQSLLMDMETSEAVQRDFVKLSQSLQIQLEKIRQAETEVRWQHEEDVDDCNNCKQTFSVTKRKHHCRHCGKVFCSECTVKSVPSGPQQRPARVCDVCHTILVKDATPYFSSDPPQTPD